MGTLLILGLVAALIYLVYKGRSSPQIQGTPDFEQAAKMAERQYQRFMAFQHKNVDDALKRLSEYERDKKVREYSLSSAKELEDNLKGAKAWLRSVQNAKEMYVRLLTKFSSNRETTTQVITDWVQYTDNLEELRTESELSDRYIDAGLDPFGDEGLHTVFERDRLRHAQLDEIDKKFKSLLKQ